MTHYTLAHTLADSSDPNNPPADEFRRVMDETRRIAVVGLSKDPSKAARRVPSYMAAKGYEVIPVNPNADRILGKTAVPSLDDVTEPVDMVLVFRPPKHAAQVIRKAAARPERPVIWLQEGIRADDEANEAREQGLVVIQDLCIYKVHRAVTPVPI